MSSNNTAKPVISVRRLRVRLSAGKLSSAKRGGVQALEGVDLDIREGETLGIYGEARSGKSTLAKVIAGLIKPTTGNVSCAEGFGGASGEVSGTASLVHYIPQNPRDGLARWSTVERCLWQSVPSPKASRQMTSVDPAPVEPSISILEKVGLPDDVAKLRIRRLSDEQCRRLQIAIAVLNQPRMVICDEPVAALPSGARGAVIDLLSRLSDEYRWNLVYTTRDAQVVRGLGGRIVVLSVGRIMEQGLVNDILNGPAHPYTRAMNALAVEMANAEPGGAWPQIPGESPNSVHPPMGCVFHPRCSMAEPECVRAVPYLLRCLRPGQYAACHFAPRALSSND